MNVITRGIKNSFRNYIRLIAIVIIVGLSIGLSLTMVIAKQAVSNKINSVNSGIQPTITISPAGIVGFSGSGNLLTESQLSFLASQNNVSSVAEILNDRLSSSQTSLVSSQPLGKFGQRLFARFGGDFGGNVNLSNFTPPVTVEGTNDPSTLAGSIGGGNLKLVSGSIFSPNTTSDLALLGENLATKNNLKVGSTFSAYNTTFTVDGIYSTSNKFSSNQVIMPLSVVQNLSGQTGEVSTAIVNVNSIANLNSLTNLVKNKLGSNADVTNSINQAQDVTSELNNIESISLYSLIGAMIAGAVIIFLIMVMIVRERKKEIGILKAIGGSNFIVISQFVVESVTLTLIGSILGIIISFFSANPIIKILVSSNSTTSASPTTRFGGGGFGGGAFSASGGGNFTLHSFTGKGLFSGLKNNISNIHAVVGYSIIFDGILFAVIIGVIGSIAASILIVKIRPSEVIRSE